MLRCFRTAVCKQTTHQLRLLGRKATPKTETLSETDQKIQDDILKEYEHTIKEEQSDFKSEFGFSETLQEIRKDTLRKEKGFKRQFEVLFTVLLLFGFSIFTLFLDREGAKKFMTFYYTHKTHLKLLLLEFRARDTAILKRIDTVRNYLDELHQSNSKNPGFLAILMQDIATTSKQLQLLLQSKEQKSNHKDAAQEVLDVTCQIIEEYDPKAHKPLLEKSLPLFLQIFESLYSPGLNLKYPDSLVKRSLNAISEYAGIQENEYNLLRVTKLLKHIISSYSVSVDDKEAVESILKDILIGLEKTNQLNEPDTLHSDLTIELRMYHQKLKQRLLLDIMSIINHPNIKSFVFSSELRNSLLNQFEGK